MASASRITQVVIGVLLLLVPASPARAYDYDTHYLWTYYLALHVGYSPRQAYQIASATFAVDHDPQTGPMEASGPEALQNAPNDRIENVWIRFHAFADARWASLEELTPGGFTEIYTRMSQQIAARSGQPSLQRSDARLLAEHAGAVMVGDPAMVRQIREQNRSDLWELALESGNPGVYLHFVQDIYSHWDFDSRHGHFYASHAPDYVSYNVPRSREMTTETIRALEDFARAKGFATRPVNVERVMEVLDQLVTANPPVWGDNWRYYDLVMQSGIDAFALLATTFGRLQENAGVVPAGTTTATKVAFALIPKIVGVGSPDGPAAWRVVTAAVADDLRRGRLPSFPELQIVNVPGPEDRFGGHYEWVEYDYDKTGQVANPAFAVEWPEVIVGDAKLECAPDPGSADQMQLTLRVPYEIRGAATLPLYPLAVYYGSTVSDSAARQDRIEQRGNGKYEHVRNLRAARARLNGSNKWTETIAVGPGNEHAVVEAPLQCGQIPSPAQPPRLASPPPAPIACPVSPSLGAGNWPRSYYGDLQNGLLCGGPTCVVRCEYGQGPGWRSVGIIWNHKDASDCGRLSSATTFSRNWSLQRDLNPRGRDELGSSAEERDPEGKRLLDQLEAAATPYTWKCPTAGSAPAITKTSWLRPTGTTPSGGGGIFDPNDRRSVLAILAETASRGGAPAGPAPQVAAGDVMPPAGQTGAVRIMIGGRVVEATYEQQADPRGVAIDLYFYATPPGPGGQAPGEAQRWSRFVRVPSVRANSNEPVVWWHAHWVYGTNGWQYVQEQGAPPQTPR